MSLLPVLSQLRNQQLKSENQDLEDELSSERQRSANRLSSLEVEVMRLAEAVSEGIGGRIPAFGRGGK